MTHEERLDRLERIARLMVKAGLRARRQMREQAEKINILIDSQIKSEEREARIDGRLDRLAEAQARSDERQARSDERLDRLVETVDRYISERRNGNA